MNDKPKKTSKIEPTFAGQIGAKAGAQAQGAA